MALATPNQLWRLNKLGRLTLVDVGVEVMGMDHRQADEAIKQSMGIESSADGGVSEGTSAVTAGLEGHSRPIDRDHPCAKLVPGRE